MIHILWYVQREDERYTIQVFRFRVLCYTAKPRRRAHAGSSVVRRHIDRCLVANGILGLPQRRRSLELLSAPGPQVNP